MSNKPKVKEPEKDKKVPKDTMSRQRVEQIQSSAMGRMRKRLYEMGITSINDLI